MISMRGSAESIVCLLILGTLEAIRTNRRGLSALLYGLSVHFKIFPIIYALPLWLNIPFRADGIKSKYFWSWERLIFGISSGFVFLGLTLIFYYMYILDFLIVIDMVMNFYMKLICIISSEKIIDTTFLYTFIQSIFHRQKMGYIPIGFLVLLAPLYLNLL
jgi:hypothetical protein